MSVRTRGKPEAAVMRSCIDLLTVTGAYIVRVNSGAIKVDRRLIRLAPAGTPDILACIQGTFWGIECKAPGGRATPLQLATLDAIHRAGGVGVVVDSAEALIACLRAERLWQGD